MGQRRCTAEEAFGVLRSASGHRNVNSVTCPGELLTNLADRPPTEPEIRS
ncbi:ANTAR domain-containing protein [Streptomyces kanamyceticus]